MRITTEVSLVDFETWSGATDTVKYLTNSELIELETWITELYEDDLTSTDVNDFLWFERDMIANYFGYDDFDELMER